MCLWPRSPYGIQSLPRLANLNSRALHRRGGNYISKYLRHRRSACEMRYKSISRKSTRGVYRKEGVARGVGDFKGHNLPVQLHCGSGHFPPPGYVPVGHGRGFRREMGKQTRVKRRAATAYTLRINIFFYSHLKISTEK